MKIGPAARIGKRQTSAPRAPFGPWCTSKANPRKGWIGLPKARDLARPFVGRAPIGLEQTFEPGRTTGSAPTFGALTPGLERTFEALTPCWEQTFGAQRLTGWVLNASHPLIVRPRRLYPPAGPKRYHQSPKSQRSSRRPSNKKNHICSHTWLGLSRGCACSHLPVGQWEIRKVRTASRSQ